MALVEHQAIESHLFGVLAYSTARGRWHIDEQLGVAAYLSLVSPDVACGPRGAANATLVCGGASGVVAGVDSRAAVQERVGECIAAVILQGGQARVDAGLVPGATEGTRAVAVQVVALGDEITATINPQAAVGDDGVYEGH